MDDDLDAFFDEVEEVEEKVKKQIEDEITEDKGNEHNESKSITDQEVGLDQPPPIKKARLTPTTSSATVVVAKKAVVASALPQPSMPKSEPLIHHITVPDPIIPIPPPLPPQQPPLPKEGHPNDTTNIKKNKNLKRTAAGQTWTDTTLADFPENDFRLFVGNLAKDINDAKLAEAFSSKYSSFAMAKIVYDKTTQVSKGYGFVSLLDARDCARALREMDQSWLGSRPIKVKRSDWKERDLKTVQKEKKRKNKNHLW